MSRLNTRSLKFLLIATVAIVGMSFITSNAKAKDRDRNNDKKPQNATELIQRVVENDVGWDYVPNCGDGAHWSTKEEECKGGNGRDHYSNEKQGGYGLMNQQELIKKVQEVNVGWDWIPRCGDHAHWSSHDGYCKGGAG